MVLSYGGDHVVFNLFKDSKFPSISDECYGIDVIDTFVRDKVTNYVPSDPTKHCMLLDGTSKDENPEVTVCAHFLEAFSQISLSLTRVEELMGDDKSSFDKECAPKVELKSLS